MKRLFLVLFLLASPRGSPHLLAQSGDIPLAFTNVTVIDVSGGVAEASRTVVIEGDRIMAVGAADEVAVPAGAAVVDGTGKFLHPRPLGHARALLGRIRPVRHLPAALRR